MSWTEELYKIYEYNSGREFEPGEPEMLPVAHTNIDVHLEITVSEDGEFLDVSQVPKNDKTTIRPNTGKAKTGKNPPPFPLTESVKYLAGDFNKYKPEDTDKKVFGDNTWFYNEYLKLMQDWNDSDYSHKAVKAVVSYVSKGVLISDCLKSGAFELDDSKHLKPKQYGVDVDKVTIRFRVSYLDLTLETRTWKDKTLYDSFLTFNGQSRGNEQLCYATGKVLPSQYIHPAQILKGAINAKLLSSNDDKNFTYRGRFTSKEEAYSVSYEFSEKMHKALIWLIEKQSLSFGNYKSVDSLTVIVWASALQPIPNVNDSLLSEDDLDLDEGESIPSTVPEFINLLKKRMFGIGDALISQTKIMIMGLDAATTGRLGISFYEELEASQFINSIEKWHRETACMKYDSKREKYINSFSIYEIANNAFGTEQDGKILCDNKLMRDILLRLLSCITNGKKIPKDIVNALYLKASNPLAYDNRSNHRAVLETACGMIRQQMMHGKNREDDYLMAYDPNFINRDYLYGCLLAIADKAENEAFDKEERNVRVTNARRYWNVFSQRPCQIWGILEKNLNPYLIKLKIKQVKYNKWINEIQSKMTAEMFSDNSRLSQIYLLGYHHFTAYMFEQEIKNKEVKGINKEEN